MIVASYSNHLAFAFHILKVESQSPAAKLARAPYIHAESSSYPLFILQGVSYISSS